LDDTDLLICKPITKIFSEQPPKQTLEVSKYISINFFKDLLLFLYAFLLSFNVFDHSMKSKKNKGKEEEDDDDDKDDEYENENENENKNKNDDNESRKEGQGQGQNQGREKRKTFTYRRGAIRMNNYRKLKYLINVNEPVIN